MKEWLSAAEIGEAKLPDLPHTKRGVQFVATRDGWDDHPLYARQRPGRGGGMEYHYHLLPTLAQIAYSQRHMVVGADLTPANDEQAQPEKPSASLTDRAARERDARLAVVMAFERFSKGQHLRHISLLQIFTDKYNMGSIKVDEWVKDLVPRVAKRTLDDWRSKVRNGDADKLAVDRGLARKGTGVLDAANGGAVRDFILALIAYQPHLAAHDVRTQCQARFGKALDVRGKSVPLPPVRAFQRTISGLKAENRVALTKLTNPDHYRSNMAPAGTGTYRHITKPNQLWMIDASPVDVLCTDGRHSMYGSIDIATRRFTITVSKTPRASAVALMIRKAILKWGVPAVIKTDNGSDFVARDTKRLFASLGIEPDPSDAYTPQQKGHIERAIKTFQHQVGPLLPGFIGHSVADRKAIESRKSFAQRLGEDERETFGVELTAAQLQVYIDQWLDLVYERQPHGGFRGENAGKSPFQVAAESAATIRRVDERALDLLLMPVAGKDGQRTVTKFGIRIDGYHYATPHILPGTPVFVRMDPLDVGHVLAFAQDGSEFLGDGWCAELAGIHPATLQKVTRQTHSEIIERGTRSIRREIKELAKRPLIEAALRVAAEEADNVVAMPKRTEEHTTPQIAAAIAAMDEREGKRRSTKLDPDTIAEHRRLIEEMDDATVNATFERGVARHEAEQAEEAKAALPENVTALETPKQRYRRAVAIREAFDRGQADKYDVLWLGRYETTDEFRGQQAVHADFGDAYLT